MSSETTENTGLDESEKFLQAGELCERLPTLPVVKSLKGYQFRLTDEDLILIEDLVSQGAKPNYVAYSLGISEKEFNRIMNNNVRIETAVKKGLANDEQELKNKAREMALAGNVGMLCWYMKNKNGWRDNSDKQTAQIAVINVNTGIDRTTEPGLLPDQD